MRPIYTSELSFWEELARINDVNKTEWSREWSLVRFMNKRVIKQNHAGVKCGVKCLITVLLKNELEDTKCL